MSVDEQRHWPGLSMLDVLRPPVGQVAEYAIIATYSVDLVAVVAAMLALADQDNDDGSGSKVAFAQAFEALRDRFRVICQAGRIVVPNKTPEVLVLLDHFVREVQVDERIASWHPKAALVRFTSAETDGEPQKDEWRLWIGSRNLTRTTSWEAGIVLVGSVSGPGTAIQGITQLGARLAHYANLQDLDGGELNDQLQALQWRAPNGVNVRRIELFDPHEIRKWPEPPEGLKALTIVSPFLDGEAVKILGHWGDKGTDRRLLSTLSELVSLHSQRRRIFEGFSDLLSMDEPDSLDVYAIPESLTDDVDSADEALPTRGLHAKLILAETSSQKILYLGSANTSRRGLSGGNSEVIAHLEVEDNVSEGLKAFVEQIAHIIRLEDIPEKLEIVEDADVIESLESARKQVAIRWNVTQRTNQSQITLATEVFPHPDDERILLSVSLFPGGVRAHWPRQNPTISLPMNERLIPSELVEIQLQLAQRTISWLQRAPLDPPRSHEADIMLLSRHMDARTFLQWVRALLNGHTPGDGGGPWDETLPGQKRNSGKTADLIWWAPTVEDVLRAWTRNPNSVAETDRRIRRYLEYVEARDDTDSASWEVLEDFKETWSVITQVLG